MLNEGQWSMNYDKKQQQKKQPKKTTFSSTHNQIPGTYQWVIKLAAGIMVACLLFQIIIEVQWTDCKHKGPYKWERGTKQKVKVMKDEKNLICSYWLENWEWDKPGNAGSL